MNQTIITSNILYSKIIDFYVKQYLLLISKKDLYNRNRPDHYLKDFKIYNEDDIVDFRTLFSIVVHMGSVCKQWRELMIRRVYPRCYVVPTDMPHFIEVVQRDPYQFRIASLAYDPVYGEKKIEQEMLYRLVSLRQPYSAYTLEQVRAAVSIRHSDTFFFDSIEQTVEYTELDELLSVTMEDFVTGSNRQPVIKHLVARYLDGQNTAQVIQRLLNKFPTIKQVYLMGIDRSTPYSGRESMFVVPSHTHIRKMYIKDFSDYTLLDQFQNCSALSTLSVDFDPFNIASLIHHPTITSLQVSSSSILNKKDLLRFLNVNNTVRKLKIQYTDIENNIHSEPIINTKIEKLAIISKGSFYILRFLDLWQCNSGIEQLSIHYAVAHNILEKHPNIKSLDMKTIYKPPPSPSPQHQHQQQNIDENTFFPFLSKLHTLKLQALDKDLLWIDQIINYNNHNTFSTPNLTNLRISFQFSTWDWDSAKLPPSITTLSIFVPFHTNDISKIYNFLKNNRSLVDFSVYNFQNHFNFDMCKAKLANFILNETNLKSIYLGNDNQFIKLLTMDNK